MLALEHPSVRRAQCGTCGSSGRLPYRVNGNCRAERRRGSRPVRALLPPHASGDVCALRGQRQPRGPRGRRDGVRPLLQRRPGPPRGLRGVRETGSGGRPGRGPGPVPELPAAPAVRLRVVRAGRAARARDRCRYRAPVLDLLPPASYRPVRTLRAGHCQTAVQLRDRPGDLLPLLATAIRHLPQLRGAQGVRARRSIRCPDLRDLPWPSPTAESLRVLRSTEAAAIDPGSGPDLRTMLRHSAPRTRAMRALPPDQAAGRRRRPGSPSLRAVQRRRPAPRLPPVRTDRPIACRPSLPDLRRHRTRHQPAHRA